MAQTKDSPIKTLGRCNVKSKPRERNSEVRNLGPQADATNRCHDITSSVGKSECGTPNGGMASCPQEGREDEPDSGGACGRSTTTGLFVLYLYLVSEDQI